MSIVPRHHEFEWLRGIQDAAELVRSIEAVESTTVDRGIANLLASIHRWVEVEALSVVLYNGEKEHLELRAVSGADFSEEDRTAETYRSKHNITGDVFISGNAEFINQLSSDPRCNARMWSMWRERMKSHSYRNAAFIPFSSELECRGVFRAHNRMDHGAPSDFTPEDFEVLQTIAELVSGVIELLWERQNVAEINATIAPLGSKVDMSSTAAAIVHAATRLANSPAAALYIIEPFDHEYLRLAAVTGFHRQHPELTRFRVIGSLSGEVAVTGKSRVEPDLQNAQVANGVVGREEKFISAVIVPTPARQLKGCLVVFSRERREYHRSTVQALENLGLVAASILDSRAQSETMAELTLHLANAGHSARTPAQRISNTLDEIREIARRGNFWRHIESQITSAWDEIALLNRRLDSWLLVSKDSIAAMGLRYSEESLSSIVNRSAKRLSGEAGERNIEIHIDASVDRLPSVQVDADKIELALDNLIENAVKYSWRDKRVDIRGESTSRNICISITDQGLGIPEALYESIFDPTSRSPFPDRQRYIPGTGLGLQIVKNIVHAHHGTIRVESTPFLSDPHRISQYEGFTTTFWVVLPRD